MQTYRRSDMESYRHTCTGRRHSSWPCLIRNPRAFNRGLCSERCNFEADDGQHPGCSLPVFGKPNNLQNSESVQDTIEWVHNFITKLYKIELLLFWQLCGLRCFFEGIVAFSSQFISQKWDTSGYAGVVRCCGQEPSFTMPSLAKGDAGMLAVEVRPGDQPWGSASPALKGPCAKISLGSESISSLLQLWV